jgi:hypothetical protein
MQLALLLNILMEFLNQIEDIIKELNNDAGLAIYPSSLFHTNNIHFHLAMLPQSKFILYALKS